MEKTMSVNKDENDKKGRLSKIRKLFAGMLLGSTLLITQPAHANVRISDDPICKEFAETKRAVLYAHNNILGPYKPKFTTLDFHEQSIILSKNAKYENYLVVEEKGRKIAEKYGTGMETKCLEEIGFWEEMRKELKSHETKNVKEYGEKNNDWRDIVKFIITIAMLYAFIKNLKAD
jgi:hypothetical protein